MNVNITIDVGFKNLSWCVMKEKLENELNYVILDHKVQSIYSKKVKKQAIDWEEVNQNLFVVFSDLFENLKYDNCSIKAIYIEKQLHYNIKACMLSTAIFSCIYTLLRKNTVQEIPLIAFLNAKKKINCLRFFLLKTL